MTDTVNLAEDLFTMVNADAASPEISFWLDSVKQVAMAHLKACKKYSDQMDEVDEALANYEEAFLFLYGLALKNGWVSSEGYSNGKSH